MATSFQPPQGPRDTIGPARVDPAGWTGPTRGQVRGSGWRRTSRGFYVPADVDASRPEQRIVEAAAVLPAYGAITGWAALRWCGAQYFSGLQKDGLSERPVEIATLDWIRSQAGIRTVEERLAPDEMVVVDGLRVTTVPRSVCFEMRYAPDLKGAMVAMDMAARDDVCSVREAAAYAATLNGWTGIPQCRAGLALADENAWSPLEVSTRKVWMIDAGLPRPLCNQPVFDRSGRHVATPDLLDVEAGVAVEYNGSVHLTTAGRARDLAREEELRALGLEYVEVLAPHMKDPVGLVVPRLWAAHERGTRRPTEDRRWTIEPPPWWRPTWSVDQRRALPPDVRERLLRYRVA